jgi:hypothetical protein
MIASLDDIYSTPMLSFLCMAPDRWMVRVPCYLGECTPISYYCSFSEILTHSWCFIATVLQQYLFCGYTA